MTEWLVNDWTINLKLFSCDNLNPTDVTAAAAEKIGRSEENFVKMMNDKAKELGMENTCFKNSHGIDEEGHYTTNDIKIRLL